MPRPEATDPPESAVLDDAAEPSTTAPAGKAEMDPDIAAHVGAAVAAALDKKALDIQVLHLGAVTDFTDFFLVASAANERQAEAISDAVLTVLRQRGVRPLHSEGLSQAKWVLLDFGDFVAHIFDQETRGFYALERLWSDAPDVTTRFTAAS